MDNNKFTEEEQDEMSWWLANFGAVCIWIPICSWLAAINFRYVPAPWHLPGFVTIICGCLIGDILTSVYFYGKLRKSDGQKNQ